MKKLLTIAILSVSTAALAYPEFTGNQSLTVDECIKCIKANKGKVTIEDIVQKLRELNVPEEEVKQYETELTKALATEYETEVNATVQEAQN